MTIRQIKTLKACFNEQVLVVTSRAGTIHRQWWRCPGNHRPSDRSDRNPSGRWQEESLKPCRTVQYVVIKSKEKIKSRPSRPSLTVRHSSTFCPMWLQRLLSKPFIVSLICGSVNCYHRESNGLTWCLNDVLQAIPLSASLSSNYTHV